MQMILRLARSTMCTGITQCFENLNRTKRQSKCEFALHLGLDIHLVLSDIRAPGSQVFDLGHWLSWATALQIADDGILSLLKYDSQSLTPTFYILYLSGLLAFCLWENFNEYSGDMT